jgi:hypothetical protein
MGGGLMQLVAYGAQDVYLTGNPQITFFKVIYRRHTNFACESIEQTFNGSVGFGRKVTATVSRNGDLITHCYVQAKLPTLSDAANGARYVNSVGHAILKEVELEIGGQRIDRHYADWLEIWSELTTPAEKRDGYKAMVGKFDATPSLEGGNTLFIPLIFFFNRNPGLALPLIALQYHELKLNFSFESLDKLVYGSANKAADGELEATLYVEYIYLDTDERRRFAQISHEMLIEQLQFTGKETLTPGGNNRVRLNFNHPVKELIWVVKENGVDSDPFNYSNTAGGDGVEALGGPDPVVTAKLQLNGHDRFSERSGQYFRLVQPYQHHTNVPRRAIYCYSFALKPEDHQPSGTCNFSRIDNATLALQTADSSGDELLVYAVNYNVLRIMSGMGGLAYSN